MAEPKTKVNEADVKAFLKSVADGQRLEDCLAILNMMEEITGEKAKMWGTSIVGFGTYHYKSTRSSQEGDWPRTGFSPRKQNLTIYIIPGFEGHAELMAKLGKYKCSKSCLYFQKLADLDISVLKQLIQESIKVMKQRYPENA